jgi:hypothetical protein
VLGTRERPCPFHPCRGPESRPAFCDGPSPAPHSEPGGWKSESPGVPGRARSSVCDGPKLRHGQTDVVNLYIRYFKCPIGTQGVAKEKTTNKKKEGSLHRCKAHKAFYFGKARSFKLYT